MDRTGVRIQMEIIMRNSLVCMKKKAKIVINE